MKTTLTNEQLAAELVRLAEVIVDTYGERTNLLSMAVRMENVRIYTRGGKWVDKTYKDEGLACEIDVLHVVPTRGALGAVKLRDGIAMVVDRRRANLLLRQFQKLLPLEGLASL